MPLSSLGVAQSALAAIRLASNESAFSKVSLHSIFSFIFLFSLSAGRYLTGL
jgi:hypothetical protein